MKSHNIDTTDMYRHSIFLVRIGTNFIIHLRFVMDFFDFVLNKRGLFTSCHLSYKYEIAILLSVPIQVINRLVCMMRWRCNKIKKRTHKRWLDLWKSFNWKNRYFCSSEHWPPIKLFFLPRWMTPRIEPWKDAYTCALLTCSPKFGLHVNMKRLIISNHIWTPNIIENNEAFQYYVMLKTKEMTSQNKKIDTWCAYRCGKALVSNIAVNFYYPVFKVGRIFVGISHKQSPEVLFD